MKRGGGQNKNLKNCKNMEGKCPKKRRNTKNRNTGPAYVGESGGWGWRRKSAASISVGTAPAPSTSKPAFTLNIWKTNKQRQNYWKVHTFEGEKSETNSVVTIWEGGGKVVFLRWVRAEWGWGWWRWARWRKRWTWAEKEEKEGDKSENGVNSEGSLSDPSKRGRAGWLTHWHWSRWGFSWCCRSSPQHLLPGCKSSPGSSPGLWRK